MRMKTRKHETVGLRQSNCFPAKRNHLNFLDAVYFYLLSDSRMPSQYSLMIRRIIRNVPTTVCGPDEHQTWTAECRGGSISNYNYQSSPAASASFRLPSSVHRSTHARPVVRERRCQWRNSCWSLGTGQLQTLTTSHAQHDAEIYRPSTSSVGYASKKSTVSDMPAKVFSLKHASTSAMNFSTNYMDTGYISYSARI